MIVIISRRNARACESVTRLKPKCVAFFYISCSSSVAQLATNFDRSVLPARLD